MFFIRTVVTERNLTKLCHMFGSEPHLKVNLKNSEIPLKREAFIPHISGHLITTYKREYLRIGTRYWTKGKN